MVALLSTGKIEVSGPSRSNSFNVSRFKTDNYTIRAAQGFNTAEVKYGVTWSCLTQAEANALGTLFDNTNGVDLIQWTPPFEDSELNFTVSDYSTSIENSSGGTYTYRVTANLIKEYDLT